MLGNQHTTDCATSSFLCLQFCVLTVLCAGLSGILEEWVTCHFHCKTTLERRPTAWTPQFMIVLDSITEKLLVQLHYSAELEGRNGQDIWQKALIYLLASAASAVTGT
jgi:tetrahydromethanopterin S-methyltransferase subunit E